MPEFKNLNQIDTASFDKILSDAKTPQILLDFIGLVRKFIDDCENLSTYSTNMLRFLEDILKWNFSMV